MIRSFKHKGLEIFFFTNSTKGIVAGHAKRLTERLQFSDAAVHPLDMDKPSYDLHQLKGKLKGQWSIKVSGNWRIFYIFENGNAEIINYEDYH